MKRPKDIAGIEEPLYYREEFSRTHLPVISLLILAITALHYLTRNEDFYLHVIYRELYLLPIILAGFWFGFRGGGLTACVASVLYFPAIMGNIREFNNHDLGNLLQIVVFIIAGGLIGWVRDRELLQRKEKEKEANLAAMGKAVACIAHDMKAPIVAIGGCCRLIRKKLDNESAFAEKLNVIIRQTKRLETMVEDMLAFSRQPNVCCQQHSINKLLQDASLTLAEKAQSCKVILHVHYLDDDPYASFDFSRLQQALENLVGNGIEACSAKGEVNLRSWCDKNNLVIQVEDNGEGIPKHLQDIALQPFVTGKREGTGLGLAIVRKIVSAHGGSLTYGPGKHSGTKFKLVIPQA